MTENCNRPVHLKNNKQLTACNNRQSYVCARCNQRLCWRHISLRCPNGTRTGYGIQQHLTAENAELLPLRSQTKLHIVTIKRHIQLPYTEHQVAVVFHFRLPGGTFATFHTYPGGLLPNIEHRRWHPDPELTAWLTKITAREPQLTWTKRSDHLDTVKRAIQEHQTARRVRKASRGQEHPPPKETPHCSTVNKPSPTLAATSF